MLSQLSAREYLEIRHAQLDVLLAESELLRTRLRLLSRRAAVLLSRRFHLFIRQCRSARKILLCAEKTGRDWPRTRDTLDIACDRLRRLLSELDYQLPSAGTSQKDIIEFRLQPPAEIAPAALARPDKTQSGMVMNIQ